MVDEKLLTIFLAVTSAAVLIQAGILVGFYFVSRKLIGQADQAMDVTRDLLVPAENIARDLQAATERLAEFTSTAKGQLRQVEQWWQHRRAA